MSSESGHATRARTRTAIALLAIGGLVLAAAVLPAVGASAPGHSLLPDALSGADSVPGQQQSANGTAQTGETGDDATGTDASAGGDEAGEQEGSLVEGLLGTLSREAGFGGGQRDGGQRTGAGNGTGLLEPGRESDIGSDGSRVSEGLRNQSADPHFVVRSSEPSYWRTGAYDAYTGSGWELRADGDAERFPRSPAGDGDRRPVTQEYRLLQPARTLPTVWEPTAVETTPDVDLRLTEQGAVRGAERLPANATVTVESAAPPRDPRRLREAGTDYPDPIADRYTALPEGTSDRVAARTDRVAGDAATPYGTAVAVQRWLAAEKAYAPNASHDGDDAVEGFLFGMDRGNAEYFASSMAVMLRTQDVPARYVVGYTTGQKRGEDTYVVRAMDAHAWVEVYFPDVGWVPMDPTPNRQRAATNREAYLESLEDRDPDEVAEQFLDELSREGDGSGRNAANGTTPERPAADGMPGADGPRPGDDGRSGTGEGGTPDDGGGGSEPGEGGDFGGRDANESGNVVWNGSVDDAGDAGGTDREYRAELDADPVPGRSVAVRVTYGDDPAPGLTVAFNGEVVGRTNESGVVEGTVPFESELVVDVSAAAEDEPAVESLSHPGGIAGSVAGAVSGPGPASVAAPSAIASAGENGTATSRTFTVPTGVDVAVEGDAAPAESVVVRATIGDQPVPGATVRLDGDGVGETDVTGRLPVTLPPAETANLSVTRGDASGNETLQLAAVDVRASGLALPGLSVTASVTDGGDPVEGATVSAGGERATTGPDGTAAVGLPVGTSATLTAETPAGVTETTTVEYPLLPVGLLVLAALAAVVGLWSFSRRLGVGDRPLRERLAVMLRWLSGAAMSALVALAVWGERVRETLPALVARLRRSLAGAFDHLAAAIRAQAVPSPPALRTVVDRLRASFRHLLARARAAVPRRAATDPDGPARDDAGGATAASPSDARVRVRQAWREFRSRVPVADHRTKTPGELARRAVEDGYPRAPVRTLRDAIRDVEYGRRDPATYVEDVVAAERELREGEDAGEEAVADGGEDA